MCDIADMDDHIVRLFDDRLLRRVGDNVDILGSSTYKQIGIEEQTGEKIL
jgi:hypothetical protein